MKMTFGTRFLLTIVLVLAAMLGLSLCGYNYWDAEPQKDASTLGFMLSSAESQPVELPMCMDEKTREQMRVVMIEALDEALKDHVKRVFEVWLRDDRGQPGRARTGVSQGLKAYLGARQGALDWAPPLCAN
jgi:uncharacterized membrane protein YgcG